MRSQRFFVLFLCCATALAQRGSYAGRRPIGYPVITTSTTVAPLADRFGEDTSSTPSTTTLRLPLEALGDRELFDRLSKLPQDKQPFWLLNWQALEENRKNPQSYDPNPNTFILMPAEENNIPSMRTITRDSSSSEAGGGQRTNI